MPVLYYYVTVTKYTPPERCGYCRRPLPEHRGPGRPARYCKRSHRQRAYEARRRAARSSLPPGDVVVAAAELDRLHDRLYMLEAALDDVAVDLGTLRAGAAQVVRAAAYEAALRHLQSAAEDLRGFVVEPRVR